MKKKSLIAKGASFELEIADADARDRYRFKIERCDDELVVHYEGAGTGTWTFESQAVENAKSWLSLSQGHAVSSGLKKLGKTIEHDLPGFLLSRAVFRTLKTGPAQLHAAAAEPDEVHVVAKGKAHGFDVLRVQGGNVDLWVVDDETWPFVIRHNNDDVYWRLLDGDDAVEVAGEQPVGAAPAAVKGEADVIAVLGDKKASAKSRAAAIEKAKSLHTPAVRDALFAAVTDKAFAHGNYGLWLDAKTALVAHAGDPGFAEPLARAVEAALAHAKADVKAIDSEYKILEELSWIAAKHQLAHAPLAEGLRAAARSHAQRWVRELAVDRLQVFDPITQQELLAELASRDPQSPERATSAAKLLGQQPVAEIRAHAKPFVAKQTAGARADRRELWRRLFGNADKATVLALVDWLADDDADLRFALGRRIDDRLSNEASWLDDMSDAPASFETIGDIAEADGVDHATALAILRVATAMPAPNPGDEDRAAYATAWSRAITHAIGVGDLPAARALAADARAYAGDAPSIYYGAACVYALSGDAERALAELALAIDGGEDIDWMTEDSDLASLHDDPRFIKLIADARKKAEP